MEITTRLVVSSHDWGTNMSISLLTPRGPPLWELKAIENTLKPGPVSEEIPSAKIEHKASAAIAFVRSRILYGRAVLNSHGAVRFGFRHIRKHSKPL